jgi:cyclic-di-GMP-binding protein
LAGRIYDPQTFPPRLTSPMADTYSFDVVSDFDRQELVNTIDQVRRDVGQRYDLKDSNTEIEVEETSLTITTASDMTLQAVEDVLRQKATKRNLSLKIFDFQTPEAVGGNRVKQVVKLRKGLSQELAKQLSKTVRDELKKVTVSIQGESLRITGKNKDDLQQAISLLKAQDVEVPLQFENYR